MPIVHHLLLSSSVQTAYRKTGVSNRSISYTKIIYTGAYMILDAQNLHTFSQSPSNSSLASLEALVETPFSCLLTYRRPEVRSFVVVVVCCAVWLPALLLCVRFFERLTVAITGPAVVLSMQYSYQTGCRSHCQLLAILIGMQGRWNESQ